MGWRGPVTDRQLRVWTAWQVLFREGDKPDIGLDGVPAHIRKRWEGKVYAAPAALAAGTERRVRAQRIARATGRDEGAVWDELVREGK